MFVQAFNSLIIWATSLLKRAWLGFNPMYVPLLVLGYIATKVIHQAFFSPLAKIPGPRLNTITSLPIVYSTVTGNYHKYVRRLHKRYGPIVRISPRKVAISNTEDVRHVFSTHRFRKEQWYKNGASPVESIFSTMEPELNKVRRRQLGDAYAKHALAQMEDTILEHGVCSLKRRWAREIDNNGRDGVCRINYHTSFQAFAYDIISIIGFGKKFGAIENDNIRIMKWIRKFFSLFTIFQVLPFLVPVSWLVFPHLLEGLINLNKCTLDIVEDRMSQPKPTKSNAQIDILQRLIDTAHYNNDKNAHTLEEMLRAETLVLLGGGIDTTSNTMTWLMMYLAHYPEVYRRAVDEVRAAFPDKDRVIRFEGLKSLPYLSAVINESMRLRPGVIGPLPRTVPEGGTHIQGYFIPQGNIINTLLTSCGRDETLWKNPEVFDPTRFLGPDGEQLSKELMIFISGVRVCPGRHLAMMEIVTLFANILRDFDFSLPDGSPYGPNRKEAAGPDQPPYPVDIPDECLFVLRPKSPETDCWINIKRAA